MEHAQLGQHDLVPVGPGTDDAGQPAHPVGEGAGPGVDEAGREVVPRGVAGQRRVGETRAQPVVEPPVEVDEPVAQPGHPLVAAEVPVDQRFGGRLGIGGLGSAATVPPGPGPADGARRAWPSTHAPTGAGATASGTCPRTHMASSARACLQGCDRLGQEQRHATWAWSTIVS